MHSTCQSSSFDSYRIPCQKCKLKQKPAATACFRNVLTDLDLLKDLGPRALHVWFLVLKNWPCRFRGGPAFIILPETSFHLPNALDSGKQA